MMTIDDEHNYEPEVPPEPLFDEGFDLEQATVDDNTTAMPVHHFRPALASYERNLEVLYKQAATLLAVPDENNKATGHLRTLCACIELRVEWPLIGAETDKDVKRLAETISDSKLVNSKHDILDRIADELLAVGCGIETLRFLDILQQQVPVRFDNMPSSQLCRHLSQYAFEHFGNVPGWHEREGGKSDGA